MTEKRKNSGQREKSEKEGLFRRRRAAWSGWMGLSAADAPAGGGACQNSVSCASTRRCENFSAKPEISACGRVGRYFPTRLPPKGRSEVDAPVSVLFGWNGGRR